MTNKDYCARPSIPSQHVSCCISGISAQEAWLLVKAPTRSSHPASWRCSHQVNHLFADGVIHRCQPRAPAGCRFRLAPLALRSLLPPRLCCRDTCTHTCTATHAGCKVVYPSKGWFSRCTNQGIPRLFASQQMLHRRKTRYALSPANCRNPPEHLAPQLPACLLAREYNCEIRKASELFAGFVDRPKYDSLALTGRMT